MPQGQAIDQFRQLWDELDGDSESERLPDLIHFLDESPPSTPNERLAVLLLDQYRRWKLGVPRSVAEYLDLLAGYDPDDKLKIELLDEEIGHLEARDGKVDLREFLSGFPSLSNKVRERLGLLASVSQSTKSRSTVRSNIPVADPANNEKSLPPRQDIGRYRVLRQLGRGSFGVVYLAEDSDLEREVAIKLPSQERLELAGGADSFLREARVVAGLDDSGIVPVYDVGKLESGECYVVSKYVRGGDLRRFMRDNQLSNNEAASLVAKLARSLHQAHRKGLVHRDIKPGNVLMDSKGQPHIIDFGLALRDEEVTGGTTLVGTPAYMSPEQARGEGHRVDPRSDIYSLGVVLYELLTGKRPHRASSTNELLELVKHVEVRPPRQLDDTISRELDRICLRALSRRRAERYSTALDLAEELDAHVSESSDRESAKSDRESNRTTTSDSDSRGSDRWGRDSDADSAQTESGKIRVVPKGLRSFDAADADFFLELIPGPRDRHGLPDSIRFWKRKLEEADPNKTFPVGLLYGPSGCGKSSLVKAGLLPQLASHVIAFYFEASGDDTEANILNALKRHFPKLESSRSISDAMAMLRRDILRTGQKCVLIIDQFEQWLNSWDGKLCPLTQALLQCDGGRVQAIVGVRDDFWMAATRFMRELEVRLVEGENSAAVDLFGERHAQNVLAAFGRAYGGLPTTTSETSAQHLAFVRHAVSDLAEDGKVVPVRLALLAQMLKNREWTSSTLYRSGGALGVGVTFLEEAFGQHAPPSNRMHADAAKAVLDALLPEQGTNIRGRIQARERLMEASGYLDAREFAELLRILDDDLRLITPVDVTGTTDSVIANNPNSIQFYQLTHDFLVPSVRDWMNRRRQTSVAGRAELRLQERANVWSQRPEFRALPSLSEYLTISTFTKRRGWTDSERTMMRTATRSYGSIAAVALLTILGLSMAARQFFGQMRATSFRDQLMLAETEDVPVLLQENESYKRWWQPLLKSDILSDSLQPNQRRNVAVALLPDDDTQLKVLENDIISARPTELPVLIEAVRGFAPRVASTLQEELQSESKTNRLNAAAGLSLLRKELEGEQVAQRVAQDLITSPLEFSSYLPLMKFNSQKLVPWWLGYSATGPDSQRNAAAVALSEYYKPSPHELADLLEGCTPEQFQTIFPLVEEHQTELLSILKSRFEEVRHTPWPELPQRTLPNDELAAKLLSSHGMAHNSFAFASWLRLDDADAVIDAMANEGYRPTRLRPFATDDGLRASLLWVRDDRRGMSKLGLTEQEVHQLADEFETENLLVCDIAGYVDGAGAQRFAVVWEERRNAGERREFYCGKPAEESAELQKNFAGRGLRGLTQHFYSVPESAAKTTIHHDMVWGFDAEYVDEFYFDSFTEEEFAVTSLAYDCPIDVCLAKQGDGSGWYGGVWVMIDRAFDRQILSSLSLDEHLQRARQLTASGYRPATISTAELGGGRQLGASIWVRPKTTPEQESQYVRRQGNIAAALIRLGQLPRVLARLRTDCDPDLRSELVHVPYSHGCDPAAIVDALESETARETRHSLLLSLGDYPLNAIPTSQRKKLLQTVHALHQNHPDAGLHAAAEWCLTQWQQPIEVSNKPMSSDRDWYLNPIGQTMIIVDLDNQADPFVAGCHRGEIGAKWRERTYSIWIKRRFAIAMHETTVAQFSRFAREVPAANFVIREGDLQTMAQNRVNWFQAIRFCNWLNEREGISKDQWCYQVNDDGTIDIVAEYLSKTGYRLPSEAEWEFCCRAGTRDVRHFGDASTWLASYAWFEQNSGQRVHSVGLLKPNTFGLFDTLGNVGEWCHERWLGTLKRNNKIVNIDHEDDLIADRDFMRVTKGGTFSEVASDLRSSDRTGIFPYAGSDSTGFRVVRTLPSK